MRKYDSVEKVFAIHDRVRTSLSITLATTMLVTDVSDKVTKLSYVCDSFGILVKDLKH